MHRPTSRSASTPRRAPWSLVLRAPLAAALPLSAKSAPAGIQKATEQECALLDDPKIRGKMDGLLRKLLYACGREHELGLVRQSPAMALGSTEAGTDVPVNDPSGDTTPTSHTQSETAIAVNPVTGTVCSGYNDSQHFFATNEGFTGFSRSTDGGATFTDQGPLGANSSGDPSIVWRKADGKFYFAALESSGLGIWRSDDDCQTFTFVGNIHVGNDDKELMAVDNSDARSPWAGRLYTVWTDFGAGGVIRSTYSDDGGATWSAPVTISDPAGDFQGAWPVVAPNGDVFVGWVRWNPFPSGPMDIEIVRRRDFGSSGSTTRCYRACLWN